MILPDVNVLLYAHNASHPRHNAARKWWDGALSGDEPVGLPWVGVLGFLRLSTSRVVFREPLTVDEAIGYVEAWLAQPHVRVVQPGHRHPEHLFAFLRALGVAGSLTTDAHLAAVAIEHGCTLYSTDADFSRFPGLDWRNPLP